MLKGRSSKDVEVFVGASGREIAKVSIAIDRLDYNGEKKSTDFINCVAFGDTAKSLGFVKKGNLLMISGSIMSGKYNKSDGQTVYTQDVVIDGFNVILTQEKKPTTPSQPFNYDKPKPKTNPLVDFSIEEDEVDTSPVLDISSDDLPF